MLEHLIAAALFVSLNLYVLTGGADFGGGVWELFARGPRRKAQRRLIESAIAPIWEANHVWLIVVVVLLFVAFPTAFAYLMTWLHIPITLALLGIVLRGAAFAFRAYGLGSPEEVRWWGRLFAGASAVTPIMLGVIVGAVVSGNLPAPGSAPHGRLFFAPWLTPFPWILGLLTLALFAFLAAVYLAVEAESAATGVAAETAHGSAGGSESTEGRQLLVEDFRRRAIGAGTAVGVLAFAALAVAPAGAPEIWRRLGRSDWALPFHAVTGMAAVVALAALAGRRYRAARAAAVVQASLILWGWAWAQYPDLIVGHLSLGDAGAPPSVLRALLWALAAGTALLVPSFVYLYQTFKGSRRPEGR